MKKLFRTKRAGRSPIALVAVVVGAVVLSLSVGVGSAGASPAAPPGSSAKSPPSPATATGGAAPTALGHVTVGRSARNDVSPKLRDVKAKPVKTAAKHQAVQRPLPISHQRQAKRADTAVQSKLAAPNMPAAQLNFDGVGYPGVSCFCAPPDPNGEVGATQYVQMVNEGLQVFDKTTGDSLLGPESIESLWSGFGGFCETNGFGDPVVLYDQLANRWVVTEIAGIGHPTYECVAVSTTDDATGTYNRYAFDLGSLFGDNFYDYPKLSVWPDAYYMSFNIFDSAGQSFLGPQPFALDRTAMLAANPATIVSTGILSSSNQQLMPADLDGSNLPPAGAPNPFTEIGSSPDWAVWRFHVDFANPDNSTFTNTAGFCTSAITGGETWSVGGATPGIIFHNDAFFRPSGEGCGGVDLPWLDEAPAEFDVPIDGTVEVTVTLSATTDAGVTQPGTFSAQLAVTTNTPQKFDPLGVTLDVTPPKDWGKLAGTLSGTDCSGATDALRGVVFADGNDVSFTLKTDANGKYAFWASHKSNHFTLLASASGWIAQTKSADIKAGGTTTVDFTLRPVSC